MPPRILRIAIYFAGAAVALAIGYTIAQGRWWEVLALALVGGFVWWPVLTALGAFAILVPFDSVSILGAGSQGTTLTFWIGGASAAALLFTGLVRGKISFPPRAVWWWTALILWGSLTALWAIDPALCIQRLPTAFSLLVLYLVATSLQVSRRELFWVAAAAVVGGTLAASFVVSLHSSGIDFRADTRSTLAFGGHESDPNYFAASLLLPISLAVGMFASARSWSTKTLSLLAVMSMGVAVLLTMSRGALIGLVVMLLFYCYSLRVNSRVLIVLVVLGLLVAWMPQIFFARLEGTGADRGAGRLDMWRVGLAMLPRYGLRGTGLDNFPLGYQQLAGLATVFHGYSRGAHNTFLNMIVETGIVGFGLFIAGLVSQFRAARPDGNSSGLTPPLVSYKAACLGVLTAGFFLDLFWWKLFWLAWMLLVIASRAVEPPPTSEAVT